MLKTRLEGAVALQFHMPSPALAPYISTYYLTEVNQDAGESVEDWLHPEWANLRFTQDQCWSSALGDAPLQKLPQAIFTGPSCLPGHFVIEGRARIWGIGILPLGWSRLINGPASDLVDQTIDAHSSPHCAHLAGITDRVFGDARNPAEEAQRIDAFLLDLLAGRAPSEEEARIHAAHTALISDEVNSVAELAERLGISARSLERLSLRAFGFSPKLLLRRQRFLRSLAQFMLDPSLSWIKTLDLHYVDQAHFVRDFKRFMAMSPSHYAALDHPVLRAAAQARAATAGAAVQALHRP
ncbi:MAG: helix-turn-helix domain-containing protein [Novosphingobium sp.]|uniref:helix-turn-helix domain-containing protein n=1 Tax=Novosphingobium sp. TaxID=1874826 RepID=UPI0032BDFAD8